MDAGFVDRGGSGRIERAATVVIYCALVESAEVFPSPPAQVAAKPGP